MKTETKIAEENIEIMEEEFGKQKTELGDQNSQRKKDGKGFSYQDHLETRNKIGEDIRKENMPVDVDNHADTSKGCGKEFMWIESLNDKRICGQMEDLKHSNHILLCKSCKKKTGTCKKCEHRENDKRK